MKLRDHKELEQILRGNSQKIKLNKRDYTPAEIYESTKLKKLLVNENPKLAHQLYLQWEDKYLGRIFANIYNRDPNYGEQAAHIANELGILGIKTPFSRVRADVKDFEKKRFNRLR